MHPPTLHIPAPSSLAAVPLLRVAVQGAVPKLLDYQTTLPVPPVGARVHVPLGSKTVWGMVVDHIHAPPQPGITLKPILDSLDTNPVLDSTMLQLVSFASTYYHHPLGQSLFSSLPPALRKGQPCPTDPPAPPVTHPHNTPEPPWPLHAEQRHATEQITQALGSFATFLLLGITGSGKTEVYLHLIESCAPRSVLVLIPEIGLAPQTYARFQKRFPHRRIACLHSKTPPKQRLLVWQQAQHGLIDVLIGTRMALWTPLPSLGLIVVDEEHDASFKQQEGMRYSARDLAVIRGQITSCPVVLGSATPSLETLHNAQSHKYRMVSLTQRTGVSHTPTFEVVDLRRQPLHGGMAPCVWQALRDTVARGEQAIVFINRRGFSPVLLCHTCGEKIPCPACDALMIYHEQYDTLRCPHCNRQRERRPCDTCGASTWVPVGYGTERLEAILQSDLSAQIVRLDRDSIQKKGDLEAILSAFAQRQADVLIGTQMIAKGHHFPHVSLVAILDVDQGLYSSDFRALERMGQLITQVAGRAGRTHTQGRVILQTHEPHHPMLQCLLQQGYPAFANLLLAQRQQAGLPPFRHGVLVQATSRDPQAPFAFLEILKRRLRTAPPTDCWGPMSAPLARKDHTFRANVYLQTTDRRQRALLLQQVAEHVPYIRVGKRVACRWEVDPLDFNG